ncbi:hypothetical protein LSAT2_025195 [Lamellibrachia satsuma]|nr:hypothetical protein LSAT2_025195 [Lamellibrachia satsuma]
MHLHDLFLANRANLRRLFPVSSSSSLCQFLASTRSFGSRGDVASKRQLTLTRQASDVGNRITANVPLSNPVDSISDVTAPGGLLRELLQGRNVIWVGNPMSAFGPKVKKQADQTPTGSQKPRKLRVVEATPHTLRLDWIAPKGFYEGYVARLIGDGSSVISTEVELTRKETSYRFKDLQPATPYAFQVAVRGRTLGEFVSVNAATCPMPPRNLKLLSTTATTATIDWDAPDSCTFVDIYLYSVMRLNSGVADESNASVGSTMATHNVYTLQGNGGDYVVEVKAVKHEAVSKAAKMTFSLESIEFTVDIAFVIDAVMSNADTVKTIVNQLLGWPQIAESDARCGIIKFDDTGDKAEVALPLNAYYAKDVEKKLNEMTFYEGDATNTAAGMWTMFEMFRNLRAAEAEAEDDEQAENTENKADATRNADDKALNTTNAADDAAKFAIVITDSVENINECLMEKQESESMNENVKIFVIGIGKFDGGPQLNNLKKLASSPTKQFVFVLDEDYCPMAIIRNAIINKMSEKRESFLFRCPCQSQPSSGCLLSF